MYLIHKSLLFLLNIGFISSKTQRTYTRMPKQQNLHKMYINKQILLTVGKISKTDLLFWLFGRMLKNRDIDIATNEELKKTC